MEALDGVLKTFYYGICDMAKWLFAIKMASNLIKNMENCDIKTTIMDLANGAFSYGALYAIVGILDAVKIK